MSEQLSMTSNRPYLLRALLDWIVDNDLTPHVVVDANFEAVEVPRQFVENGKIVLNISPFAVRDFQLENEFVSFSARFGGSPMNLYLPMQAILAIYARENGQGMVFTEEAEPSAGSQKEKATGPVAVENNGNSDDDDPEPNPPKPGGGKPRLKLVK